MDQSIAQVLSAKRMSEGPRRSLGTVSLVQHLCVNPSITSLTMFTGSGNGLAVQRRVSVSVLVMLECKLEPVFWTCWSVSWSQCPGHAGVSVDVNEIQCPGNAGV